MSIVLLKFVSYVREMTFVVSRTCLPSANEVAGRLMFPQVSVNLFTRISLVPDLFLGVGYPWSQVLLGGRVSLVPGTFWGSSTVHLFFIFLLIRSTGPTFFLVTVWNLVIIAVERYLAVCQPFKHSNFTKSTVYKSFIVNYILSLIFNFGSCFQVSLMSSIGYIYVKTSFQMDSNSFISFLILHFDFSNCSSL